MACSSQKVPLGAYIDAENATRYDVSTNGVEVDGWRIMMLKSINNPVRRIYIEGDGKVYFSRGVESGDPTPENPVGLRLMLRDKGDGAVYLGRPCQWVRGPECKDRQLWITKRFTEEVVRHYVALVSRLSEGREVELVGYSGGAWVALQVAARLDNVSRVVTVAGNLAPDWVNAQHKVTRIPVAEYPAGRLAELPVTAYVGTDDKIVAAGVVEEYRRLTGARRVEVVPVAASHGEGWEGLVISDK